MSQLWLHSDWHLWHQRIYEFTYTDATGVERRVRERFANAAEGDAYIEQRWRDLIKVSDHVWVLGDVTMNRGNHMKHEFIKLFNSLPGHKRIIPGNHDHYLTKVYAEAGFEKMSGGRLIDGVLLTHYPVHQSSLGPKIIGNVHGHTHQNPDISPRHINVSVERTDYEPVPLEEVRKRLEAKIAADDILQRSALDVQGNLITGY